MKMLFFACLILFSFFNAPQLYAITNKKLDELPLTSEVNAGLNQLLARESSKATVGMLVQSLHTGRIIYAKNANNLLIPASNLKIVTAYAALRYLGPDYKFQTQLFSDAASNNAMPSSPHTLNGNLYIKFSGDPTLTLDEFSNLFEQLAASGITTINGKVFVDHTEYDEEGIAPGTNPTDTGYCFDAPVQTTIFNHNCVSFTVQPGNRIGSPAKISFPTGIGLPIINQAYTKNSATRLSALILHNLNNGQYQLSGYISPKAHNQGLVIPLSNSNAVGVVATRNLLKQHGISVLANNLPVHNSTAQVLITHESEPLSRIVTDMLKRSDNLIANTLYKKLGASYFKQPGSWDNGGKAIKAILSGKNGIDLSSMHMIDGSGLSRYNSISPSQLVQILRASYTDPSLSSIFMNALPVDGIDGTLKHRMLSRDMIGQVKAKTGTLRDVTSLAGYLDTSRHEPLVFAIVVNDTGGLRWRFRAMQDKICHFLHLRA